MGDPGRIENSKVSSSTNLDLGSHLLFQHQGLSTGNPSINMSTKNRLLTQCPLSTQTTKLTSDTKNRLLPNWSSSLSSNLKNLDISSSNLSNKSIYASSFVENEKQPSSPNSKRRELILSSSLHVNENCLTNIKTSSHLLSSTIINATPPSMSQYSFPAAEKQQYDFLASKAALLSDTSIYKRGTVSNDESNHKTVKDGRVDSLSKYSCQNKLLQSTLTSTDCEMTMNCASSSSIKHSDEKLCSKKESVNSINEYDRITDRNRVVPERKSDNAEIDSNVKQNVKPPPIEKLREAMVVESEEDKALFSQNAWRSKSKSKKELEIHRKTLLDKKIRLIKEISVSLLDNPNLMDAHNETRLKILKCSIDVAITDPEFILKVALYCRHELNLRSPTNLLLAFASLHKPCRPFLPRYFSACINIPSDWLAVADFVQTFPTTDEGEISDADVYLSARNYRRRDEKNLNEQQAKNDVKSVPSGNEDPCFRKNLPAILRKVMTAKFAEFDEYQLAKYNKNRRRVKSDICNKKSKSRISKQSGSYPLLDGLSDNEIMSEKTMEIDDGEINQQKRKSENKNCNEIEKGFTLKRLVRLLHIDKPVFHVMAILGKRYPSNQNDFYASRLPGTFEENMAGNRLKLATPMTWETQIAMQVFFQK